MKKLMFVSIKIRNFYPKKDTNKETNKQTTDGEKIFAIHYLIKDGFLRYKITLTTQ